MTLEEKVAQMCAFIFPIPRDILNDFIISIQGDIDGWMNTDNPLDNTLVFNESGLVCTDN